MPRSLRPLVPDGIYHVFTHGIDDRCVFPTTRDRLQFLDLTATTIRLFGWRCYIETLMDTHYHLLVQTPEPNLDLGMQFLNGTYGQLFNKQHGRRGHLWEARYNHRFVDTDSYLLELVRYIALNAVEVAKAERPEDYVWCSYGPTIGIGLQWPFIANDELIALFGSTREKAIPAMREFVADRIALRRFASRQPRDASLAFAA